MTHSASNHDTDSNGSVTDSKEKSSSSSTNSINAFGWIKPTVGYLLQLSWVVWIITGCCLAAIYNLPTSGLEFWLAWYLMNFAGTVVLVIMRFSKPRLADDDEITTPVPGNLVGGLAPEPIEVVEPVAEPGSSLGKDAMRRLAKNRLAMLSLGLISILVVMCFGQGCVYSWHESAHLAALEQEKVTETPIPTDQLSSWAKRYRDPNSFFSLHLNHIRTNDDESLQPPTPRHWFGTDVLGRDIFARTLSGGRISFLVALVATAVSLVIGVSWGATSGFLGGRIDNLMMRFVDLLYGLPFMFFVILVLALFNGLQNTARVYEGKQEARQVLVDAEFNAKTEKEKKSAKEKLAAFDKENKIPDNPAERQQIWWAVDIAKHLDPVLIMFFALGLVSWLTMARITRGQVLSIKEREFIDAARAVGASTPRIIFLHVIPNLMGPVIVFTTLSIPTVMLSEAFLSFLGLGVADPQCSWGSLASDGLAGINAVYPYWWPLLYPSAAISLALFSLNFVGDGLRDALDPKAGK